MSTTFVVSPLEQLGSLLGFGLTAVGGLKLERAVRETSLRHDGGLLMALRRAKQSYVPGFLFAGAADHGSLDEELHAVATAPSRVVARQMGRFLESVRAVRGPEPAELRKITTALEAGERAFAQRIARELGRFWSASVSARWNSVRQAAEGDIRHRAAAIAEHGLAATLNSLHPALTYDSGTLRIQDPRTLQVRETSRITLCPAPLATTWLLRTDPWGEDGTHLTYPVSSGRSGIRPAADPAVSDSLGQVIGQARFLLLSDLDRPRITIELAERHHMTASTVSYHLTRLHRVGLLNRIREGNRVYYQRTSEGDRLVVRQGRARAAQRPDRGLRPVTGAKWAAGTIEIAPHVSMC
ncbi:winged helix-turn-helix domain-containing protein [Streptomyces sp. NPDC056161]|uniref:helix-turn-helix domain-containing protein n=1 Tax=Streptomyces sp. NPDC056161 TaxID=3345732 RepID=UPI0035D6740D